MKKTGYVTCTVKRINIRSNKEFDLHNDFMRALTMSVKGSFKILPTDIYAN